MWLALRVLEAGRWRIELPGLTAATIEAAVADMLARAPVTVPRMTKSGSRDIAVTDNWVTHQAQEGELVVTVRAATPTAAAAAALPRYDELARQGHDYIRRCLA